MKHVLSLLMIFVLLEAHAHALSGGPVFVTSDPNIGIGTFAGVLLPSGKDETSGLTASTSNSLGVFSIASPSTGLATGQFSYFDSGKTYVGSITGVVDPDKLTLRALVKGQFAFSEQFNFADTTSTTAVVVFAGPAGYATGSLTATLESSVNTFGGGTQSIRLNGTADLDVQAANVNTAAPTGPVASLKLTVDGFKQSDTVNGAIDLSSLLNNSITGSSGTTN